MRKTMVYVLLLAALVLSAGCASARLRAPVVPPIGVIYTSIKAPLSVNFDQTKLGSKTGTSQTKYLYIPSYGILSFSWEGMDVGAALEEAKRAGGITTVTHADYEYLNVLGIWQTVKIEAHGE